MSWVEAALAGRLLGSLVVAAFWWEEQG